MKMIEKIVHSFWTKMISLTVIILDCAFLTIGFALGDAAHSLHTVGLFITCFVDIVLGAEILIEFNLLYQSKVEQNTVNKVSEINKKNVDEKINNLKSEIQVINEINKMDMIIKANEWFEEAKKINSDPNAITAYVSGKYNDLIVENQKQIQELVENVRQETCKITL